MSGLPAKVSIGAARNYLSDVLELHVYVPNGNGSFAVATNVIFETVSPNVYPSPLITLGSTEAQRLMNDLYNAGYRPSQRLSGDEVQAAQAEHIKDLRALVFGLMNAVVGARAGADDGSA